MTDLRAYFSQRTDEILNLLHQLVEIESPSTDKTATDRIGEFVAQRAHQAGAAVNIIPQESCGDLLLARWREGKGNFLILCHLDTVWSLGTLTERPWRVEGDKVFAPGCFDEKASTAIILTAMQGLRDLGLTPCRPVTVLFNCDEEIGSFSSRPFIEAEARQAEVVFCMEPALPDGALKVRRKGPIRYTITALGRAAHSGIDHEKGINAIEELAHQILHLQGMTNYATGTTVSVGRVQGGTRANVVPDQATAWLDARVQTEAEGRQIVAAVEGLRPVLPGVRLVIEGGMIRPPMEESPMTMKPFHHAQEIGASLGLALTAGGTGGASDANFTAALGIPTLDGLGAEGDGAHSLDEHIVIPSLPERTALIAALLSRWEPTN